MEVSPKTNHKKITMKTAKTNKLWRPDDTEKASGGARNREGRRHVLRPDRRGNSRVWEGLLLARSGPCARGYSCRPAAEAFWGILTHSRSCGCRRCRAAPRVRNRFDN